MYAFSTIIDGPFDAAQEKLTATMHEHGPLGIVSEINVAAILKNKLDIDRRPYKILGGCNPKLANSVIESDENAGVLLPCNVLMAEQEDGRIKVSFQDPAAMLSLLDNNSAAEEVAQQATAMIKRIIDNL